MKILRSNNKIDIFHVTRRKVVFTSIFIVMLCLCIFSFIVNHIFNLNVMNMIDRGLIKEKEIIEKLILRPSKDNEEVGKDKKTLPPVMNPKIIEIVYYNDKLDIIKPNTYFDENDIPDLSNVAGSSSPMDVEYNGYKFRVCSFKVNNFKGYLLSNVDSEFKSVQQLRKTLFLSFIILFLIALGLAYYLSYRIIKPVKEAYDKQVFFVQDASHEMRTPLAVIKGKVELLTKSLNNISNDELFHISKIMSELRRLEKMNSDLLLLAKEDIGESNNLKEFYLEDMVGDIRGFYTDMAEIKDKIFNIYSNTNIQVLWDYDKVKRVLIILIENAFKYTGEKGIITVVFEENYKNINVHVKDNGIGIKKEDQERIFDRFFRTENVRGNNIEGSGIGLSLLKSLCKSLNIEVVVNSEFRKGSEFILLIPKIMNL